MVDRKITRIALILLSVWTLSGNAAFAQAEDPQAERARAAAEEAQRRLQEFRAAEEDRQRREQGTRALNDFLNDGPAQRASAARASEVQRAKEHAIQLHRLRSAFASFMSAREELSGALGRSKLKDPAQKMAKSTGVFLDFLKRKSKPSRFDPAEFKDFAPTELGWEALTSAERVSPLLAAVIQAESEALVNVRLLQSLSKLQAELLRLQWMTKKLK